MGSEVRLWRWTIWLCAFVLGGLVGLLLDGWPGFWRGLGWTVVVWLALQIITGLLHISQHVRRAAEREERHDG